MINGFEPRSATLKAAVLPVKLIAKLTISFAFLLFVFIFYIAKLGRVIGSSLVEWFTNRYT